MSKYYNINGLKIRVSDHEPNFAMDKIRGRNDVEFYTVDIDNKKLSVVSQIENYCDKHNLDVSQFSEIAEDFPDEEFEEYTPEKIEVNQDIVEGFLSITGKGSIKKREKYCKRVGVDWYKMNQGYYTIKGK